MRWRPGGVIGPLAAGWLAEHLGYNGFFYTFSAIAAVGAAVFLLGMPETAAGNVANTGARHFGCKGLRHKHCCMRDLSVLAVALPD